MTGSTVRPSPLTGLAANDLRVPGRAVSWLTKQQCADGSFVSLPGQGLRCVPGPGPSRLQRPGLQLHRHGRDGPRAAGENQAARAAVRYLRGIQNRDGGFPTTPAGPATPTAPG